MGPDDAGFEEFARRIGRFFLSWSALESAINQVLSAIIDHYVDPAAPLDKPRNLSKKTEFIRRFFREHSSWHFISDTVDSLMGEVEYLADARHALAHGQILDLAKVTAGADLIIVLNKRSKGKERLLQFTITHDQLLEAGRLSFVHAVFVARLAEIVSNNLGDDDLDKLLSQIVSEVAGPLPITDCGRDMPD